MKFALPHLSSLAFALTALTSQAAPLTWVARDLGTSMDAASFDSGANRNREGLIGQAFCAAWVNGSCEQSLASVYSSQTGIESVLGGFGGRGAQTLGVSANGQLATGYADRPGNEPQQAFLYRNGQMIDLGTPSGLSSSYGTDVNNAGQVVGDHAIGWGRFGAFLYDGQEVRSLGGLAGAVSTHARRINESGQVVGQSFGYVGGNYFNHAFLYQGGQMTDLGTLGGSQSTALGLNESGRVVGASLTAGDADWDAYMSEQGQLINLDSLVGGIGLVDTSYAYFDWDGEVVGFGQTAAGEGRWFQLSLAAQAVPEPASLGLGALGLAGLLATRRRRHRGA